MKITLKPVLVIVLRTCKTVSRKLCINREDSRKISQFSYTVIVVEISIKFIAALSSSFIHLGFSTRKMLW